MKTKKTRSYCWLFAVFLCLAVLPGGGYVYRHEKRQSERIALLEQNIALLKKELKSQNQTIAWEDGAFCYLAIGNSITQHGLADYWWSSDRGMAASTTDSDYFHIVCDRLEERKGKLDAKAINAFFWETMHTDRAEALGILRSYFSARLDLVTIQLGENATNLNTFYSDFVYLIQLIKERCPEAQILVVGDFWEYQGRDKLKERAASETGAVYVSLAEIKDKPAYQAGLGTIVYGDDGEPHDIDHAGVAVHPGDLGMKQIAENILAALAE